MYTAAPWRRTPTTKSENRQTRGGRFLKIRRMALDSTICYEAVLARDTRYDGQFFTCVKTTKIYCRPICPAKPPLPQHCTFVPSAAAAQDAGYRPCLRCRPESSPGMGAWCGTSTSVQRALSLIDLGALDGGNVASLADRLGMGDRHLRRLFSQHLGTSPLAVAQTRRLLLAKQLIHQTNLPMTDVALASGFGSVRRFNETFQHLFGRPPGALRRHKAPTATPGSDIELLLAYRPPYNWPCMLDFLRARAIPGVECVDQQNYSRVIDIDGHIGLVVVDHLPDRQALRVKVRTTKLAQLPSIIARVRRVFDLSADPVAIAASLSRDARLAPLIAAQPGLRVPGAWDGFETAVRAVLGQQITVTGATRLAAQLVGLLGQAIRGWPDHPGLTHAFPQPEAFNLAALAPLGMPTTRRAALADLATSVMARPHLLTHQHSLEEAVAQLCALPGIGEWTAQYIAMRALRESDAFPAADIGLQRAMAVNGERPSARALLQHAEQWRPWRAYAVLHLWTSETTHHATAA